MWCVCVHTHTGVSQCVKVRPWKDVLIFKDLDIKDILIIFKDTIAIWPEGLGSRYCQTAMR